MASVQGYFDQAAVADPCRRFRFLGGQLYPHAIHRCGVSSGPGETCPCDAAGDGVTNKGRYAQPSTSADDDGGYFADRMAALRRAGELSVR